MWKEIKEKIAKILLLPAGAFTCNVPYVFYMEKYRQHHAEKLFRPSSTSQPRPALTWGSGLSQRLLLKPDPSSRSVRRRLNILNGSVVQLLESWTNTSVSMRPSSALQNAAACHPAQSGKLETVFTK